MNTTNNILDRIAAKTRERISVEMRQVPLSEIRRQAEWILQDSRDFSSLSGSFRRALARPGISFICEVKKASGHRQRIRGGRRGGNLLPDGAALVPGFRSISEGNCLTSIDSGSAEGLHH